MRETSASLTARAVPSKTPRSNLAPDAEVERVVVKFHEGTHVRLRGASLVPVAAERSAEERANIQRLRLSDSLLGSEVAQVQSLLGGRAQRLFRQSEQELTAFERAGEQATGRDLADLNLYFELPQNGRRAADVETLVAQLNALESVEIAYAQPPSVPAQVDISPVTPSFENEQGYLEAAPNGVDARYAWTVPGGNGAGVRIVDVEGAWRVTHEDMPPLFRQGGTQFNDIGWRNHGTAVLGVMVGAANGYGVRGIAWGANAGFEAIGAQSTASAISNAASAAGRGGVVLIELHAGGPAGTSCTCNQSQCGYIAMEYWQGEFDAIATASANGVIVVEAAGNGSANLDDARYGGAFDRRVRDSGAILVGAGNGAGRVPTCWTNNGSRVDVFGWGEGVTTLGYGARFNPNNDENQWYTGGFNGTSSASPVVVGAVADLQGAVLARGRPALSAAEIRDLLVRTGTPQASGTQAIGRMPNLRAAIEAIPQNLALNKPTTQSSTALAAPPGRAVDGNRDGNWTANSVSHTNSELNAWWQLDLGAVTDIGEVVIYNRSDCCGDRLSDFDVRISNDGSTWQTINNFGGAASARTSLSVAAAGRYLQIRLRGTNYLSLAEVEVFAPKNLARGRLATQSSTFPGGTSDAARAIDGNRDGNWSASSVAHTDFGAQPWWQVDLGSITDVGQVVLYNRTDCCGDRLADFDVRFSDDGVTWPTSYAFNGVAGVRTVVAVAAAGRYVQIRLRGTNYLSLAEVELYPPQNMALGKNSLQSSTLQGAEAGRAVDGNRNGTFGVGSVSHTNSEAQPWWRVDLGGTRIFRKMVIYNRTDCCSTRLANFVVERSADGSFWTTAATVAGPAGARIDVPMLGNTGRYLRVRLQGTDFLNMAEVEVFRP